MSFHKRITYEWNVLDENFIDLGIAPETVDLD